VQDTKIDFKTNGYQTIWTMYFACYHFDDIVYVFFLFSLLSCLNVWMVHRKIIDFFYTFVVSIYTSSLNREIKNKQKKDINIVLLSFSCAL